MTLRTENGRFDSVRPKPLPGEPPCATNHVIPATDPSNPTEERRLLRRRPAPGLRPGLGRGQLRLRGRQRAGGGGRDQPRPDEGQRHHRPSFPRPGLSDQVPAHHGDPGLRGGLRHRGRALRPGVGPAREPPSALRPVGGRGSPERRAGSQRHGADRPDPAALRVGAAPRARRAAGGRAGSPVGGHDAPQHVPLLLRPPRVRCHRARADVRAHDRGGARHRDPARRGPPARERAGARPSATRPSGASTWPRRSPWCSRCTV